MKKIAVLLIFCLLLAGCGSQSAVATEVESTETVTEMVSEETETEAAE